MASPLLKRGADPLLHLAYAGSSGQRDEQLVQLAIACELRLDRAVVHDA